MKILMGSLLALAFSALIFTPALPKEYPTKESLQDKRVIGYKEEKLKRSFKNLEYLVKKDSLEIELLKKDIN